MIINYTQEEYNNACDSDKLKLICVNCNQQFFKYKKCINKVLKHTKCSSPCNKDCVAYTNTCRFCTEVCCGLYKTKQTSVQLNCEQCGIIFHRKKSQLHKSKHFFCGLSCFGKYYNAHKNYGIRRSKLEVWLEQQLQELYPEIIFSFNNISAVNSELDIYIPNLNLAFELNGIFHYEPIYGQDRLSKIQNNDNRKFQACLEQGIELCIIDSSQMKNFKVNNAIKYLDIIKNIIDNKIT